MDTKEFAEKFIQAENDAFQNGDFTALSQLENPNVVYHMSTSYRDTDLIGFEAHKQSILSWPQWFSSLKQEWRYLVGEGDLFALSYKAQYISKGNIPGLPSAGKEASADSLFLYRLEHGKIVEVWNKSIFKGIDLATALKK